MPKRIQEMHQAYGGNNKQILYSRGDHAAERESFILNACMEMIFDEFKKNQFWAKQSKAEERSFPSLRNDGYFADLSKNFLRNLKENLTNV